MKERSKNAKIMKYKQSFQRTEILSLVKAIANSSQGRNAAAIWAERFSELFYMGVDGSVIAEEIITPDFVYKLFAGKSDSAVFNKEEEEVVFSWRQIHLFSVDHNKAAGKINNKSFELKNFLCFRNGNSAAF